jgi:signal transduction histidine kinase/CheY-like chemotaxis protein
MVRRLSGRCRPWRDNPWLWLAPPIVHTLLILLMRQLAPTVQAAIWPTSGVFAAGVLLLRPRDRLKAIVASGVLTLAPVLMGGVWSKGLAGFFEACALSVLASVLCGPNPDFSRGRTLTTLGGAVILPVTLASATLLYLVFPAAPEIRWATAVNWFLSHLLGAAVFLPALSVILDGGRFASVRGSVREMILAACAMTGAAVVFLMLGDRSLVFLIFPMAMLLTFRHGPVGSAVATLLLSVMGLVYVYGFAAQDETDARLIDSVQWVQAFVAIVLLTTLPAGGAIAANARVRSLLARRTEAAKAARRRADAAAAAKGEFLANLSHEIRTPLNGVIGLADALSRSDLTPPQRDLLKMILASGKALTGLLSDALDLARADSGALRLSVEPVDIRQTVSEAAYLFESIAREKGIGFAVHFDLEAPGAAADALRIKQIVSNLISNAVKFTEQGEVEVRVAYRALDYGRGALEVVVRDTGPGFDETVKARLFQRFEQADASVTRRYGGSGLGLSIAYKLARLMDGTLTADARPGEGAVFRFAAHLPIAELKARPAPVDEEDVAALDDRPVRVLLAEDNHVNQKVIQAMIGAFVELTIVENGEAAVDAFHSQAYDVILMDTHMPVLDGLSAIRRIRAEESAGGLPRTPIISLTADAMPQQVEAARIAGADLHVAKPITAETLIRSLQAALAARAASEAA